MTAIHPNVVATVSPLPLNRGEEAVRVLADAFCECSVMRHIIGNRNGDFDPFLHKLLRLFVAERYSRDDPVLAVSDSEGAVAVAMVVSPETKDTPRTVTEHREALWSQLGQSARERYEALGAIWDRFSVPNPHYELNMIGVREPYKGGGLGRRLLDTVHEISMDDADSAGVSLNVNDAADVSLYEHFGYEVVGGAKVCDDLETWVMFRPDKVQSTPL